MSRTMRVLEGIGSRLPPAGSALSYLYAGAAVLAALALKLLLDAVAGASAPPFITFYPAVVIAGLVGGPRAGVAAAFAAVLVAWWLWVPVFGSFRVADRPTQVALLAFVVLVPLTGWLTGCARLAFDAAIAMRAERERTARESVHRIKNLLTVVQAIAARTARDAESVAAFNKSLQARLKALDAAQTVLIRRNFEPAPLAEVVEAALAPFRPIGNLTVEPGPAVTVSARTVSGLCLALYELCTNALKYGALSDGPSAGEAHLTWTVADGRVVVTWRERLSQPAAPRAASGFGVRLIQSALSAEPGGEATYAFEGLHVNATFAWPAANAPATPPEAPSAQP